MKAKRLCELSFWLMLLVSPFLDMINGIWTYLLAGGDGGMLSTLDLPESSGIGPSLAVRLVFLALMLVYLLLIRHRRAIFAFMAIGGAWILTFAFSFMRGVEYDAFAEIEYIVRFCYSLMVLVVAEHVLRSSASRLDLRAAVDKVLCLAALTAAIGVLLPYILGMGFYTYADPLGYRGSRGFYYAGNDITVVLMLILPLMLAAWMEKEGKPGLWSWLQAVAAALSVVAMLIIGTKTAFVAVIVIGAAMLVYACVDAFRSKGTRVLLRLVIVAAMAFAVFELLALMNADPSSTIKNSVAATGQYAEQSGAELVVFSGRTTYLLMAWNDFREALPISAFVGVGRGTQSRIIEMDIFEVLFYYGAFGSVAMLWLYLTNGIRAVIDLFRCFSLRNLACCVALGLCVGFLALAGHVLFSVTAGFYFAFLLTYTRLCCSRKGIETRMI